MTSQHPVRMQWVTNAPSHWPPVITRVFPVPMTPQERLEAFFAVAAGLKEGLDSTNGACEFKCMAYHFLDYYGLLEVDAMVRDGATTIPVLFLYSADYDSASYFAGAQEFFQRRGLPQPVYYAPGSLPGSYARSPFKPFELKNLEKWKGKVPQGEYAMWWNTQQDPLFLHSYASPLIGRFYRGLEGYETYLFNVLLRQLEIKTDDDAAVKLPVKPYRIPCVGPEDQLVILSFSREKGVQFHFPVRTCAPYYRDAFWAVLASYADGLRAWAKHNTVRPILYAEGHGPPTEWWRSMRESLRMLEKERGEEFVRTGDGLKLGLFTKE